MASLTGEMATEFSIALEDRSATRKFEVRAASKNEAELDIIFAANVTYGDAHPRYPFIFATEFAASQDSKVWWKWIVTVDYTYPEFDDEENNPFDNPLLRPPKISYDTESLAVPVLGINGEAITASTGEPFDPPPLEDIEILIISITRWGTPFFSLSLFEQFQNAVNASDFTFGDRVIAARTAKLRIRISPVEKVVKPPATGNAESVVFYRQFDLTIAVHPRTWDVAYLDAGTYYYKDATLVRFADEGIEIGTLDGIGGKLPLGATPFFRQVPSKKSADFGLLTLPAGP